LIHSYRFFTQLESFSFSGLFCFFGQDFPLLPELPSGVYYSTRMPVRGNLFSPTSEWAVRFSTPLPSSVSRYRPPPPPPPPPHLPVYWALIPLPPVYSGYLHGCPCPANAIPDSSTPSCDPEAFDLVCFLDLIFFFPQTPGFPLTAPLLL